MVHLWAKFNMLKLYEKNNVLRFYRIYNAVYWGRLSNRTQERPQLYLWSEKQPKAAIQKE